MTKQNIKIENLVQLLRKHGHHHVTTNTLPQHLEAILNRLKDLEHYNSDQK